MVFHWKLSDSMSPQVYSTLFSPQADLNNAVVSIVSIGFSISNFSSLHSKPSGTVQTPQLQFVLLSSLCFPVF